MTLGLIAVASWQNYSDVKNLVSKEASVIAVELRRERVDEVDDGLPLVLWVVVGIGGLLTIAASYFFWIEDIRFHLVLLFMLTTFIALMIYLIAALDRPFRGNVSITAESYELIVRKVMDSVDTG